MRTGCEFRPNTERILGIVQQKPQNDKRSRRCYRCDPLGHVREHAPVADLALPRIASRICETSGLVSCIIYGSTYREIGKDGKVVLELARISHRFLLNNPRMTLGFPSELTILSYSNTAMCSAELGDTFGLSSLPLPSPAAIHPKPLGFPCERGVTGEAISDSVLLSIASINVHFPAVSILSNHRARPSIRANRYSESRKNAPSKP